MKTLERLHLSTLIPVQIPDKVLDKIKFLCQNMTRVEWSGIIFYEVKGTIRQPSKMRITIKDILLMDRGSPGATGFNWDGDIVEYRINNPETIDYVVGHIHSHNTMNVFFSSTDWEELNDNCPNHNIYLSVIVNNYMEMEAKIAFTAEPNVFTCKDEEGKDYTMRINLAEGESITPYMFIYDCKLFFKKQDIPIDNEFRIRLAKVNNNADIRDREEAARRASSTSITHYQGGNHHNVSKDHQNSNSYAASKNRMPDWPGSKSGLSSIADKLLFENEDKLDPEEEFAIFILRLGNPSIEGDTMMDAIEDISVSELPLQFYLDTIKSNYEVYYNNFFDTTTDKEGDFAKILDEVISLCSEYKRDYKFMEGVIEVLNILKERTDSMTQNENQS